MRQSSTFGINVEGFSIDFAAVMSRVRAIVDQGIAWYEQEIASDDGVDLYREEALFTSPTTLRAGKTQISFRHALIASGARPSPLSIPGADLPGVVTSDGLLQATELPDRLVCIGGGAVGLEFAQAYRRFGASVSVLQRGSQIAKGEDPELAALLADYLGEEGIEIALDATVDRLEKTASGIVVHCADGRLVEADRVLVATGRAPAVQGLGLEEIGVDATRQGVVVDSELRTSLPNIYAIGDAIGGYMFTHVSTYEASRAVANMLDGAGRHPDYRVVPRATFTDPELAGAGLSEPQAREAGYEVEIRRHDVGRTGKARALGDRRGRVKLVIDAASGELLGAHILARHGADLLPGPMIAMNTTARDLGALLATTFPHPTLSESVKIAARSRPT